MVGLKLLICLTSRVEFADHLLVHQLEFQDRLVCDWLNYRFGWDGNRLVNETQTLWKLWEFVRHVEGASVKLLLLGDEHMRDAILILNLNLVASLDEAILVVVLVGAEHVAELLLIEELDTAAVTLNVEESWMCHALWWWEELALVFDVTAVFHSW